MLKNKLFLGLGLLSMALALVVSGVPSKAFADTSITSASVTGFLMPVIYVAPQSAVTLSAGATTYTITSLTWSGNPVTFAPATAYTATVVLTSATGYKFPVGGLTPTVNLGVASAGVVSGGDVSGNTLTFTDVFPATSAAVVTGQQGSEDGVGGDNAFENSMESSMGGSVSSSASMMASVNESISGCDGRTTGFSRVSGVSCVGNVVTSPTTTNSPGSIPGCDTRTTGFSISTGVSCVGNVVSATSTTTTTSNSYNFGNTVLKDGSKGDAVKELQKYLNDKLNLGLSLDGVLGAKTVSIIKDWQKTHGLTADGLVGAKTKSMMESDN